MFCPVRQLGSSGLTLLHSTTTSQEKVHLLIFEKCHMLVGDWIELCLSLPPTHIEVVTPNTSKCRFYLETGSIDR